MALYYSPKTLEELDTYKPKDSNSPYHVESLPAGYCIMNKNNLNILSLPDGAVLTSKYVAEYLCDNWNRI